MKPAELNKTAVAIVALVCLTVVACFGVWALGRPANVSTEAQEGQGVRQVASGATQPNSSAVASKSGQAGALGDVLAVEVIRVAKVISNADRALAQSQLSVAKLFVNESLKTSLVRFRIDMGDYPSTEEGIKALIVAPEGKADKWRGPYMDAKGGRGPLDPWNQEYQYRYPGTKNTDSYNLFSCGPDGRPGTADDIGNW
jgi:general secretion pathway protein G